MPITVLADVILPSTIVTAGVRGKNLRLNSRVSTDNGFENINIVWTKTIRQFEIGIMPLRVDQWQAIETLHEITEGGAYGFLMEDPKDNALSDGVLVRVSAGVFQLTKRYTHAASTRTKDRPITRPRAPTISVTSNGVGIAATIDPLTGRVTIASDPDPSTLSWSGKYLVPVHFVDDMIDWEMVVPGPTDTRFLAGPSVLLQEVRE
jgi:uncharacterized protein (TIGR02217 family)